MAPLRERYEALVADPARIEQQLRDGARRLREQHATPFLHELRNAVGLRDLSSSAIDAPAARAAKAVLPVFKQYREADGQFHFKLVDGERVLLQSAGFASPRDAGQRIASLKRDGFDAGDGVLQAGEGVSAGEINDALAALREAESAKA